MSALDVPWTLCAVLLRLVFCRPPAEDRDAPGNVCCCITLQPWYCHRAMREHASQYVWYRRLYVLFSRYVFVNTLERLP